MLAPSSTAQGSHGAVTNLVLIQTSYLSKNVIQIGVDMVSSMVAVPAHCTLKYSKQTFLTWKLDAGVEIWFIWPV